jgi:hypothetical protein
LHQQEEISWRLLIAAVLCSAFFHGVAQWVEGHPPVAVVSEDIPCVKPLSGRTSPFQGLVPCSLAKGRADEKHEHHQACKI